MNFRIKYPVWFSFLVGIAAAEIIFAGVLAEANIDSTTVSRDDFAVVALFDNDREKIGQVVGPDRIPIFDGKKIAKVVCDEGIDVCVDGAATM